MVIEQAPHILPTLDEEMAAFIEKNCLIKGRSDYFSCCRWI